MSTIIIVGAIGLFISYYARGYRLNLSTFKFEPNGILVIKSEPDGASVYINGELKTATNATLPLSPGTYDVEIRKDGFSGWYKRLTIQKEIVTSATASLFKNAPSLSPETFSGAGDPVVSPDGTKIAYTDDGGLWILDTFSLPLGFSNDPKRITDGDLTGATYLFSPDGRQVMLNISGSIFLLATGTFTPQAQRVNVASSITSTIRQWKTQEATKNNALINSLPPALADILSRKVGALSFSPDAQMILYTTSSSATIPDNLIAPLPGASTQKQQRTLQTNQTYVYDIKEDRNFLVSADPVLLGSVTSSDYSATPSAQPNLPVARWMPDARHVLFAQDAQISVMDYDGTNSQPIYTGSYVAPFAFPFRNSTEIMILTNLGASSSTPNLYTLTVK